MISFICLWIRFSYQLKYVITRKLNFGTEMQFNWIFFGQNDRKSHFFIKMGQTLLWYIDIFQKILIKKFTDNVGHWIPDISSDYAIKVKTTSFSKLFFSSFNTSTSALASNTEHRTLNHCIWGSFWPTHLICALMVPHNIRHERL